MGIVCEYLGGRHRGHDFFLNEAHFLFFCLSSPPMNEKISGNRTHRNRFVFGEFIDSTGTQQATVGLLHVESKGNGKIRTGIRSYSLYLALIVYA